MLVSRVLKYMRRIITPLVSGIVVTLIGLSLIKVGITACGGGEAAKAAGTFGSIENVGLAERKKIFQSIGQFHIKRNQIVILPNKFTFYTLFTCFPLQVIKQKRFYLIVQP